MSEDVRLIVNDIQRSYLTRIDTVKKEIIIANQNQDIEQQHLLVGYQNGLVEAMRLAEEYVNA